MRKSTRGALAASAAALLLMGGLGTQAKWTDNGTVTGTSISTGNLSLINPHCNGWLFLGSPFDPLAIKIVPGDVLTQVCTFEVDVAGANIAAELNVTAPAFQTTNGLTSELTPEAVYKKGATTISSMPAALSDGDVITATITVTLPMSTATNGSQNLTAQLQAITVTATQV